MADTFFPEPKTVTVRDKTIEVSPLSVKNIGKAVTYVEPLIKELAENGVAPMVILKHTDEVIALCALATNQDADFLGELNAAELLSIITLVVQVNADFFVSAIMPQMTNLMKSVQTTAETVKESQAGTEA